MPQAWAEGSTTGQRGKAKSVMTDKMLKYATVVHQMNEHRRNGKPYAPISAFMSTAAKVDDSDIVSHPLPNTPLPPPLPLHLFFSSLTTCVEKRRSKGLLEIADEHAT